MAIPYSGGVVGSKDAYNFYHSQLRIKIECTFGIFTERWGILRSALPMGISLGKTTALVIALAKLHNFCIDHNDSLQPATSSDQLNIESQPGGHVVMVAREITGNQHVPEELLDVGHHFLDVGRRERHRNDALLPRSILAAKVEEANLCRPTVNVRTLRT